MKASIRFSEEVSTQKRYLLSILSGTLLTLSYPDFNLFYFGWISFIPLLIAIRNTDLRNAYLAGVIAGFTGYCIGFYWIESWARLALEVPFPFSVGFVFIYAFCFAQVFGMACGLFQWLINRVETSPVFVFPLTMVSVFSAIPMVFQFHFGDSQTTFLAGIQAIEFTGVYGLDFVMLMVNSLLYNLLFNRHDPFLSKTNIGALAIVLTWMAFGTYSLDKWSDSIDKWSYKNIGLVQANRPVSLGAPKRRGDENVESLLEFQLSKKISKQELDVIIWPEGYFFGYEFIENVKQSFKRFIQKIDTPLIFYDPTSAKKGDKTLYHNTIHYLDRNGNRLGFYHKRKLVPFGETMSMFGDLPFIGWILGDYLDNLTPGNEDKIFELDEMRLIPKTCYEPLFPDFVAESIGEDANGKVILVQSQDGWFGETSQPNQHVAATILRAVENRVPLIHVINNGPSTIVDPAGRVSFQAQAFKTGAWVSKMRFSSQHGGSFYSRNPNLFINIIRGLALLLVLYSVLIRKRKIQDFED